MAKFQCVCGEQISTSGLIPNPIEWRVISDTEFDEFQGQVSAEAVYLRMRAMFRCPASDHLWVFWDGFDAEPSVYAPVDSRREDQSVSETRPGVVPLGPD